MVTDLIQELVRGGPLQLPLRLGELTVEATATGFVVRGPATDEAEEKEIPCTPRAVREWIRYDQFGEYRPLSGLRSMRTHWRVECGSIEELIVCLDEIYPLALTHMDLLRQGRLEIVPLDQVLGRQTGRYSSVKALDETSHREVSDSLCGECVRVPVWKGETCEDTEIPCPEACSLLVERCHEAVSSK